VWKVKSNLVSRIRHKVDFSICEEGECSKEIKRLKLRRSHCTHLEEKSGLRETKLPLLRSVIGPIALWILGLDVKPIGYKIHGGN
jgi:hypothetical protein